MSADSTILVLDMILGLLNRASTLATRLGEAHSGGPAITEADVDAVLVEVSLSHQRLLDALAASKP